MLNAHNQSTIKPLHSYFPHTCWVRQVLTLAINNVAQKEEADMKSCEDVAGARRAQPPVDCLWCFVVFVSRIKRNTMIISLFFLTWYCFCYSLMSTICMKIDLGLHIVMHLVFFGKTRVTPDSLTPVCTLRTEMPLTLLASGARECRRKLNSLDGSCILGA
jgi:hypothetical protein